MKIQASTLFILTLCQKQLIRIGAIIRANPSIDVNEQDFTAAKGNVCSCSKLLTTPQTRYYQQQARHKWHHPVHPFLRRSHWGL